MKRRINEQLDMNYVDQVWRAFYRRAESYPIDTEYGMVTVLPSSDAPSSGREHVGKDYASWGNFLDLHPDDGEPIDLDVGTAFTVQLSVEDDRVVYRIFTSDGHVQAGDQLGPVSGPYAPREAAEIIWGYVEDMVHEMDFSYDLEQAQQMESRSKRRQIKEQNWGRNNWAPGPWDEEGNVYDEEEEWRDLNDEEARAWAEAHKLPILDRSDGSGWELESYAWPGGYTIVYYDYQGEVMHPDTAMEEIFNAEAERRPVYADVYYEGPQLIDFEGRKINSSYGDPDDPSYDPGADDDEFEESKTPTADRLIAKGLREQDEDDDDESVRSGGFAIYTDDEGVIEDNAVDRSQSSSDRWASEAVEPGYAESDGTITEAGWDQLNDDIQKLEKNVLNWLVENFNNARDEGHNSDGDLIGTFWYDLENKEQVQDVFDGTEEPINFFEISEELLFDGLSEFGASLLGGGISFFDVDIDELEELL